MSSQEGPDSIDLRPSLEREEGLYKKTLAQEKAFANHVFWSFLYEWPRDSVDNLHGLLNPEDIMKADAVRTNDLQSRRESLSPEEREDLTFRERGDLFYKNEYKKYAAPNVGGLLSTDGRSGPVYKEIYYLREIVKGFLDGKEVSLERMKFDVDENDLKQLEPDHADEFRREYYNGQIGGQELSVEEAKNFFGEYLGFAQKRSQEIEHLRVEKRAD